MKAVTSIAVSISALCFAAISYAQNAAPTLEDTEWGPENGLGQYIQFKSGGEVFGFGGCNTFIGNYTQKGDKIDVTTIGATKKLCEDMQGAEMAFIEGLKNAHTLKMTETDLRVYNAKGKWILGMRQRDVK
ncbi:MAG: META domain-containing protein [Maricaulaceae bacterium]